MYWVDRGSSAESPRIQRSDLDGGGVTDVLTGKHGLMAPLALALSPAGTRLYWSDGTDSTRIFSAASDGSDLKVVLKAEGEVFGIVVGADDRLYWTETAGQRIRSAKIDGTDVRTLLSGLIFPTGITLDTRSNRLYWGDDRRLRSAPLDGSSMVDVAKNRFSVMGVAVAAVSNPKWDPGAVRLEPVYQSHVTRLVPSPSTSGLSAK